MEDTCTVYMYIMYQLMHIVCCTFLPALVYDIKVVTFHHSIIGPSPLYMYIVHYTIIRPSHNYYTTQLLHLLPQIAVIGMHFQSWSSFTLCVWSVCVYWLLS